MRKVAFITALMLLAVMAKGGEAAYGGIDVGARAVRARLFVFQGNGEGRNAKELYSKTVTTSLATSMTNGKFAASSIKDASAAVSALLGDMMEIARKQKLGEVQYFILGSSSVASAANRDELRQGIADQTGGFGITFIDAKTEGYHGMRSSIPEPRRAESIVVDTGSMHTMLGCLVAPADFRTAEIPHGVVSVRNGAIDSGDYDANVQKTVDAKVKPQFRAAFLNNPCFANRQRIYWLGQAAWAATAFTHPEKSLNAYVQLTKQDLDDLIGRLRSGNWQALPKIVLPADQERHREEITRLATLDCKLVQDSFVREDFLAAVVLLRSLMDVTSPASKVYFARGGNYLYGYALEHYVETKALAPSSASASSR